MMELLTNTEIDDVAAAAVKIEERVVDYRPLRCVAGRRDDV
jgi:hypothetical protein